MKSGQSPAKLLCWHIVTCKRLYLTVKVRRIFRGYRSLEKEIQWTSQEGNTLLFHILIQDPELLTANIATFNKRVILNAYVVVNLLLVSGEYGMFL